METQTPRPSRPVVMQGKGSEAHKTRALSPASFGTARETMLMIPAIEMSTKNIDTGFIDKTEDVSRKLQNCEHLSEQETNDPMSCGQTAGLLRMPTPS